MTTRPPAVCFRCGRTPDEIPEYQPVSTGTDLSPEDYVWSEEGTLDVTTGHFACDSCYIALGMPAGRGNNRWRAP